MPKMTLQRNYPTLPPDRSIMIQDEETLLANLAERFAPQLFEPQGVQPQELLAMWWEAIPNGQELVLIYRPVWRDERHPHWLIHQLYRWYRGIVYGIPIRDIEFIQINLRCKDGQIRKIRYEGSDAKTYRAWRSPHTYISIEHHKNHWYVFL